MQLIYYYVGFMVAGDVADYLIGLVVERIWPQASLVIFLALYFVFLLLAWLLAVEHADAERWFAPAGLTGATPVRRRALSPSARA